MYTRLLFVAIVREVVDVEKPRRQIVSRLVSIVFVFTQPPRRRGNGRPWPGRLAQMARADRACGERCRTEIFP